MFKLLGISDLYGGDDVPVGTQLISRKMKVNDKFEAALDKFFGERTIEESLKILADLKVAGAKVLEVSELQSNPQYIARDSFTTWKNEAGKEFKGPNVMPKFKNNPCVIWRPMPSYGEDTADIMAHLGYTNEQVQKLNDEKIIRVKK